MEQRWRWLGPEGDLRHELIAMALDTKRVIDRIRSECIEADIWRAEQGSRPALSPTDLIEGHVRPQFLKFVDRLEELQQTPQSRHLFLAASELSEAISVRSLPADFVGEEFQEIYRCTWRATGHLVLGSEASLYHAPTRDRPELAAAAACVLLDPTAARAWEPSLFDVKGAQKILNQVIREREMDARDR